MDYAEFVEDAIEFLRNNQHNYIAADDAIRPELVGMRIFDDPLIAVASADDPLFIGLRKPEAVHPDYCLPEQWLDSAKTVISCFLPFSEQIRKANRVDFARPADEWFHGRIEGQEMVSIMATHLADQLKLAGFAAIIPSADPRFKMLTPRRANWSERHTAYICGLGTFGLSKGLITQKGIAGRFCSVVTSADLPVTQRKYSGLYDYCNRCGKCARNCPAEAIDITKDINEAKSHVICEKYVSSTTSIWPDQPNHKKYFGCGKCQVNVPCENCIPKKISAK